MTIRRIKIYGFGRHKDKEWTFENGLNVIYGENETGKSTIFAFIRSMFYGLTGRGTENYRKKCIPWNYVKGTDRFGGELEFTHKDIDYRIISLWGESKREDKVNLYNNTTGAEIRIPDGRTVGEHILQLTAGAYDSSIYIGQMSSVINASDDKDGVLVSRLSAVSGLGESEASAVKVIGRIKECMDKIRSPRGNAGILDKLYFKKTQYENDMNRLELTDGNASDSSHKLSELMAEREKISGEMQETKNKINIINSIKVINKRNKIIKLFEELDELHENADYYRKKASDVESSDDTLIVPKKSYTSIVVYIALVLACIISGIVLFKMQRIIAVLLFVAAAAFAVLTAISFVGMSKKSQKLQDDIEKDKTETLLKIKECEILIAEKEKLLDDKMDGFTFDQMEEHWKNAKVVIDDAGSRVCSVLAMESADGYIAKTEELADKINNIDSEIGYLKATIDNMYKNEKMSFSEASAKFSDICKKIEYYERKYEGLKLAKEIAEESFEELRTTFGPVLSNETENILSKIAGTKGNVKIGDDFNISVFDEDMPRNISSYSGAAVDQTYFALRLAIAGVIAPKSQPYPLLLDDPFAQYDDDRLTKAMDFLNSYEGSQIILATCQKRGAETGKSFYKL